MRFCQHLFVEEVVVGETGGEIKEKEKMKISLSLSQQFAILNLGLFQFFFQFLHAQKYGTF